MNQSSTTEPVRTPIHFPQDRLDPDALKVIRRLREHGHQAYLVGGCVRDLLLGERPKDFDLATDARPNQIKKLFRNCRIIGRRFRLAHILFAHGKVIEVATFRAATPPPSEPAPTEEITESLDSPDSPESPESPESLESPESGDSGDAPSPKDLLIRDDNVFGDAESDALRRDFTLNALFYDVQGQCVIDYTGGMQHIQERVLVAIGDPMTRLHEDPVRIIRAAKFAARLGIRVEERLWQAMKASAEEIAKASPSRLLEEIYKILAAKGSAQTFAFLQDLGLLRFILPFVAEDYAKSERGDAYWDYLRAMEWGIFRTGPRSFPIEPPPALAHPTRAILFASLMAPLLEQDTAAFEAQPDHEMRTRLLDRVQGYGVAMRNARRDTYRGQQAYLGQERLAKGAHIFPEGQNQPDPRGNRRRRGLSPKKFAERAYFAEALELFWIRACVVQDEARWKVFESWDAWKNLEPGDIPQVPDHRRGGHNRPQGTPGTPGQPQGPRSSRNRRRRRRWRGHLKSVTDTTKT